MSQRIQAAKLGLFVSNDGSVNSPVFLTRNPDELQLSPHVAPPDTVATIQGENGLFINIGPKGVEYLVWSREPREFKFSFGFAGTQISTLYAGVETLYWSLKDGSDKIYLNPYEPSFFHVG